MAEFLVEMYLSRQDADALERSVAQIRRAAGELTKQGTPVRYVRRIFVPQDETCLLLFEADSADAVREAARRGAVPFERVAEAVAEPHGEQTGSCP